MGRRERGGARQEGGERVHVPKKFMNADSPSHISKHVRSNPLPCCTTKKNVVKSLFSRKFEDGKPSYAVMYVLMCLMFVHVFVECKMK